MKPIYTLLLISLFFCGNLFAQSCLPNGIAFTTQQAIDDFATNYPGCTEIEGYVVIDDVNAGEIQNLNGLSQLTAIGGRLHIESCNQLTSLQGLQNINSIGDDIRIIFLSQLTSIQELSGLTTVAGDLEIVNYAIANLQGLQNITSIEGNLILENFDSISNLQELENLSYIGEDLFINGCDNLVSLQGLSNLDTLGGMLRILYNDGLSDLNGLENLVSVQSLNIAGNNNMVSLSGLDNLSHIEEYIGINDNESLLNIDALSNITSASGDLIITDNNSLVDLNGLDNLSSIYRITIQGNSALSDISGLNNISSLGSHLRIENNNVLTSLTGLENLDTLGGALTINANDNLTDITALENLVSIGNGFAISGNNSLTSLAGLQNVDTDAGTITILILELNPNLSVCELSNICNFIINYPNSTFISGNATNCNSELEVLSLCSNLTSLQSHTFYDINQNQIKDNDEPNYNDTPVLIEPGSLAFFPNTANGSVFIVEPGNYTATYQAIPGWELTTDSASYFLSLTENETDTIYFGIYPLQSASEQLAYINAPPARCNEIIAFDISTKNLGTTITNGTLWLEVDNNVSAVDFIDVPDITVPPNRYGWNFTDLYPSQTFSRQISIGIPGPPDFPLGDLLNFDAYAQYNDVNGAHVSPLFEYHTEVQCSFDPNDKLVNPDRTDEFEENYTLFDESLFYTVRFQNTGNAVAYDVFIKDTLDANLDWSTFQLLGSSHIDKLVTTMDNDGILTFDFQNIFLPDSTSNFEASNGYVSYLIKPLSGLIEETVIENSAGIYFDLNPPVITNTTENVMVSELPVVSTTEPDGFSGFAIIPNPNSGLFEVVGIAKGDYNILNTKGQVIQSGRLENGNSIDISAMPQGVYFISLIVEEQAVVKSIVKL